MNMVKVIWDFSHWDYIDFLILPDTANRMVTALFNGDIWSIDVCC